MTLWHVEYVKDGKLCGLLVSAATADEAMQHLAYAGTFGRVVGQVEESEREFQFPLWLVYAVGAVVLFGLAWVAASHLPAASLRVLAP